MGACVQCTIKRNKGGIKGKMYPVYEVYLESPRKLLLAAKKRTKNKTSNYLISMDRYSLDKDSNSYTGKVRSNFVGTEFLLFDDGVNPKEGGLAAEVRHQLGAVLYESNILGSKGPRRMTIILPSVDGGHSNSIQPTDPEDTITNRFKARQMDGLQMLVNKNPQWNDGLQAYVLDFHSRVTMASVKNFQLIDENDPKENVLLQFGRVAKDEFTMDISYPLSPLQGFGICLTSFDYKLACE